LKLATSRIVEELQHPVIRGASWRVNCLKSTGYAPTIRLIDIRKTSMTAIHTASTPSLAPEVARFHDLLAVAMNEASYVQVDDAVFSADYLHAPDEFTRPDDVLVEGTHEDSELLLIERDFEGASLDDDGDIVLKDGTMIRFLRSARVH
jgi:hypothetical protein